LKLQHFVIGIVVLVFTSLILITGSPFQTATMIHNIYATSDGGDDGGGDEGGGDDGGGDEDGGDDGGGDEGGGDDGGGDDGNESSEDDERDNTDGNEGDESTQSTDSDTSEEASSFFGESSTEGATTEGEDTPAQEDLSSNDAPQGLFGGALDFEQKKKLEML
jgi:hypothetical protein